jgi:hypothetical protein
MGLIREPLDVDFEVISKPLTQEDERLILEFLRKQDEKLAKTKSTSPARRLPMPLRRKKILV